MQPEIILSNYCWRDINPTFGPSYRQVLLQSKMDSIPLSELGPILSVAAVQTINTKFAIVACYAAVVYDYILTFPEEIKYIWKRRFSVVTFVYFINRYYALCDFTLLVFVEFSTAMDLSKCKRYVPFQPLGQGIPLTFFPDLVIGLRVYALYNRNKVIAVLLATYLTAELGVALWLYLTPSLSPVQLPGPPEVFNIPVLHLCIATASPKLGNLRSAAFQFMQTIYDSVVFSLIVYKTAKDAFGSHRASGVRALMARHGILYYAVVFSANFTWAMMILLSPVGLKYSAAAPTLMMACMAVNKMTLSLRGYSEPQAAQTASTADGLPPNSQPQLKRRRSWIGTSTFEIGADHIQESEESLDFNSFELQTQQTGTIYSWSGSSTMRGEKD